MFGFVVGSFFIKIKSLLMSKTRGGKRDVVLVLKMKMVSGSKKLSGK